jgi:hypothetical protein
MAASLLPTSLISVIAAAASGWAVGSTHGSDESLFTLLFGEDPEDRRADEQLLQAVFEDLQRHYRSPFMDDLVSRVEHDRRLVRRISRSRLELAGTRLAPTLDARGHELRRDVLRIVAGVAVHGGRPLAIHASALLCRHLTPSGPATPGPARHPPREVTSPGAPAEIPRDLIAALRGIGELRPELFPFTTSMLDPRTAHTPAEHTAGRAAQAQLQIRLVRLLEDRKLGLGAPGRRELASIVDEEVRFAAIARRAGPRLGTLEAHAATLADLWTAQHAAWLTESETPEGRRILQRMPGR